MIFFLPKQFSMEIIYYSTHGIVGDCKYVVTMFGLGYLIKRLTMRLPKNLLSLQLIDKLEKLFLTLWDNHLLFLMTICLNISKKYFLILNNYLLVHCFILCYS